MAAALNAAVVADAPCAAAAAVYELGVVDGVAAVAAADVSTQQVRSPFLILWKTSNVLNRCQGLLQPLLGETGANIFYLGSS